MAIIVENKDDIAKFKDYKPEGGAGDKAPAMEVTKEKP